MDYIYSLGFISIIHAKVTLKALRFKMQNKQKANFENAKVVVLGAGRSGMAAVRLLIKLKAQVSLIESNAQNIHEDFKAEMQKAGVHIIAAEHKAEHFAGVDYIIPSPGIPVTGILPLLAKENSPEILAEMELAWQCLQGEKVLAITGTSGKTTTASIAAKMFEAEGNKVFLGGNIGTPLSEYVLAGERADVLVLELSSFQLQTCTTFKPNVAVILNITENHLDYHKDMQEYIDAKLAIFAMQNEDDVAIIHKSLQPIINEQGIKPQITWLLQGSKNFEDCRLVGAHNELNIEAAWLACKALGVSLDNARKAVADFAPLEHRLELVREINNVLYVNDSKCTTTSSQKVAIEAFDRPIILLCGGKFKGGDLEGLRPLIKEKVKQVLLFGASREYFEKAWEGIVNMAWFATLDEAISYAHEMAKPNDVVLMAPATASFDLYKNYMARGDDFKRLVGAL